MKTIVSSSEVAHMWANKIQSEASNSGRTFYFKDEIIYSYGSHFPIAAHVGSVVFFTLRKYSVTTSKHMHLVARACSHLNEIYCAHPDEAKRNQHTDNLRYWFSNIRNLLTGLQGAKKETKYLRPIMRELAQMKVYTDFFNIKIKDANLNEPDRKTYKLVSSKAFRLRVDEATAKEILAEERKNDPAFMSAAQKKTAERNAKIESLFPVVMQEKREAWKSNVSEYDFVNGLTGLKLAAYKRLLRVHVYKEDIALRINNGYLETSKGIKIPLPVAQRYYNWYVNKLANGGCCGNCNEKLQGYKVSSVDENYLVVGCHNIPTSEIIETAEKMKWGFVTTIYSVINKQN